MSLDSIEVGRLTANHLGSLIRFTDKHGDERRTFTGSLTNINHVVGRTPYTKLTLTLAADQPPYEIGLDSDVEVVLGLQVADPLH